MHPLMGNLFPLALVMGLMAPWIIGFAVTGNKEGAINLSVILFVVVTALGFGSLMQYAFMNARGMV